MGPRRLAQVLFYRALGRTPPELPKPVDYRLDHILARTGREIGRYTTPPQLRVVFEERLLYAWDGVFRREDGGYILELPTVLGLDIYDKAAFLGPTYLYWLMHCPLEVGHMSVTLGDGDKSSGAMYAPSTCLPDQVPLPDPYFFLAEGFRWAREHAEANDVPWAERSDDIVWRGASSGIGTFDPAIAAAAPSRATQRLALCLLAQAMPDVDIGLTAYVRRTFKEDLLREYGLIRPKIEEQSWIGRKFAIDIDGQTNTWSNLIVRMHFGCCILKVASRHGFRQWYYDRLRPWEHYVPVKADLSDLREQIDWVRTNDAEAARIAANARELARTLTFEAARDEAAALIAANVGRDDPYGPRPLPNLSPRT